MFFAKHRRKAAKMVFLKPLPLLTNLPQNNIANALTSQRAAKLFAGSEHQRAIFFLR
jgi:hypothetical protein